MTSTNFNILKNILIFITFLISTLNLKNPIKANIYETGDNKLKEIKKNNKSNYIIGSGDLLYLVFEGLESFSNYYMINDEGYLYLPDLGYYYAEGKIIDELKNSLEKDYDKFIKDPEIDVILFRKRPITISLIGEVNRPGLYTFTDTLIDEQDMSNETAIIPSPFTIKLFDVIKKGKGITKNADIGNIKVVRENPYIHGGGKIKANIDLIKLIENGDQSQNITIYDGDQIFIPNSDLIPLEQILKASRTNLSPEFINVYVNGFVSKKGLLKLSPGTSLFEGIAYAGGKAFNTGNVEFIRLKRDGNTEKRIIPFNDKAIKGSKNNPILMSGDIIFVRKNIFSKTTDLINTVSGPIINSYGLYKIFD